MNPHWDDYDEGPPLGYFEDDNDGVQCNRCKAEGLEWEQRIGGKWVLIEPSGDQHFCSAFNQTIGDFEEIK